MEYLTIWCQLENGYFVQIRTRPAHYALRLIEEYNESAEPGRSYAAFPVGINPNQK